VIEGQKRCKERGFPISHLIKYLTAAKPPSFPVPGLKTQALSPQRVVFLVGRAAERLLLPLRSGRRFGTPPNATPPSVPSAPPAKQPLASMCSRVDKPFEAVLDRGQDYLSPETVVTGVVQTFWKRGGSTLAAVSRHGVLGLLAYVGLDLLKLAFGRSGLLHLLYIFFSAVHFSFLFGFASRFPPDT
jgi:hypothetical protein